MTDKTKGASIKHLQAQMKKELTKLSHQKARSECFSKTFSSIDFALLQEQPQRASFKTTSSRKLNTTATISSMPHKLLRQNSLEIILATNESRNKILSKGRQSPNLKLKKKKTKKDQSLPFIKLKRGDTLPQQPSGFLVSSTSLEAKCEDSSKAEEKSAKEYQQIISKYKEKIDQLENIIESMMES